jgi:hypothetical protein
MGELLNVFFFHERNNISRLSACRRENRLEESHAIIVLPSPYFFGLQHLLTPPLSGHVLAGMGGGGTFQRKVANADC